MALNAHGSRKPTRAPRLPGEGPIEWTVRTAYLASKNSGRWIINYTDIVTGPGGTTTYRTAQQACFTTDRGEAAERFAAWKVTKLTPVKTSAARGLSFVDLTELYLRDVSRDRFTRTQHSTLSPAMAFFEQDLASTITETRLRDYQDDMIRRGHKPGTQRGRLSAVLTVLRHGVKAKLIPASALPTDYRLPPPSPPRQYVLSPEQDVLVFNAAAARFMAGWTTEKERVDARVALFVCIAADSAQRRDAILALTWDRVDMTPGLETMDFRRPERQVKNKKAAVVPVSDRLLPVLKHARALAGTERVFESARVWNGIERFRVGLDLPKLTPHVFRHTWATLALKRGMPIALVARIMADSIETITKTYLHLVTDDTRDAMRRYMAPASHVPTQHRGSTHVATQQVN